MKKQFIMLFLFLAITSSFAQQWDIDKSHSTVKFGVKHLVISTVEGYFKNYEANLNTKQDGTLEKFDADIKTASVFTENTKRDEHLRSDDFFGSDKYPDMKFVSTKVKKTGKGSYKVTGDLTIKGITKPIVLDVVHNGMIKDPWGNTKTGYTATGKLDRFDYGLKWNAATEAGGLVVSKEVAITINAEFTAKKQSN